MAENTDKENRVNKTILKDATFIRFIIVGVINTIVGMSVMFLCYNAIGLNYWGSSAANYVVGSICSYILNKKFTFRSREKGSSVIIRFVINIGICYLISYGVARPLIRYLMQPYSVKVQDNAAMLLGTVAFTLMNYFGQKLFVFRKDSEGSN